MSPKAWTLASEARARLCTLLSLEAGQEMGTKCPIICSSEHIGARLQPWRLVQAYAQRLCTASSTFPARSRATCTWGVHYPLAVGAAWTWPGAATAYCLSCLCHQRHFGAWLGEIWRGQSWLVKPTPRSRARRIHVRAARAGSAAATSLLLPGLLPPHSARCGVRDARLCCHPQPCLRSPALWLLYVQRWALLTPPDWGWVPWDWGATAWGWIRL